MRKEPKWAVLLLLSGAGLIYYHYSHIPRERQPYRRIWTAIVQGKEKRLLFVKVVKIPPEIYEQIDPNNPLHKIFLGKQKQLVFVDLGTGVCGPSFKKWNRIAARQRELVPMLKKIWQQNPSFHSHYLYVDSPYKIIESPDCRCPSQPDSTKDCPHCWFQHHCMEGFCIINPRTKEAIVDHSTNPTQILPLLTTYQDWETKSLLDTLDQ